MANENNNLPCIIVSDSQNLMQWITGKQTQPPWRIIHVSIPSSSYSLEENSGSNGGVTNFRNRAQTCT